MLYIGVTHGIFKRIDEHRTGFGSAFTKKYKVHSIVWFEEFADFREAIQREKTLKHYVRDWKINLIERTNPHWVDLYHTLPGVRPIAVDVPLLNDGSSGQARGCCCG